MTLGASEPTPLYHRVSQAIKQRIETGLHRVGDPIPTEAELCAEFQVSRITVRRALDALVNEGLVERRQGRGTFVCKQKITQDLSHILAFSETVREGGMRPSTIATSITLVPAPPFVAEALRCDPGEEVVQAERLRSADGKPVSLITSYVRQEVVPGLVEQGLLNESMYQTLEKRYGIHLGSADQIIGALAADERTARLLQVHRGYPLLRLVQVTFAVDGQPIEAVVVLSRADRYQYHTKLKGRPISRI